MSPVVTTRTAGAPWRVTPTAPPRTNSAPRTIALRTRVVNRIESCLLIAAAEIAAMQLVVMILASVSATRIVAVVAQPQRVADDELTHASAGAHALLVGVAEMDPFPHPCVHHLVDALTEAGPEMIEGRVGRTVRDDGHAWCVAEQGDQDLRHAAADFVVGRRVLRMRRRREKRLPAWIGRDVDAVRIADRADRTPGVVGVLGVPARDRRVRSR